MERRSTDKPLNELIAKVNQLTTDLEKLKSDFEDHSRNEAMKVEMLSASLVSIQVKLDQLLIEIKEPMEAYKTTKYGMSFIRMVIDTAKWLGPAILIGLLGYNALLNLQDKPLEKPAIIQKGQ